MRFLERFFRAAIPAPRPVTWESIFGDDRLSTTGITVDEYSALNYSPVWAGVSILARDVAKLPLVLYKNLPNGGKEPFKAHSLYRILKDEPNPEMTSYKFRETMQALCILYGNAYAEIVRNGGGVIAGLYPIVPPRVTPERDAATGRLRYRVLNSNGAQTYVPAESMLHLSSLSTDGIIGHSIVTHGRESFELGLATERFGGAFFGNGATFGGVVEVPGLLTQETKTAVREQIEAVHAGVERAHKILVLGGGSKYQARGTDPNHAQFLETRQFQVNEVARWLGMPPHKLGDLENAHFTNIEEENTSYYVGTVSGWLKMWEQELARKCIARLEYAQQSIEHNLEGVLRGDSTKRADFYSKMFSIGAFSINRILQLENQNPIGPEGDVHLVPLNMVPLERYDEMITATLEQKRRPADPPALPGPELEADARAARETELRAAAAALETRAAALEAARVGEADRLARVVASHRALVLETFGRLTRVEVERVRRRASTAPALRTWATAFYATRRGELVEVLAPVVATVVAWRRAPADARALARELADGYCAEALAELETVLDGADAEEFRDGLERLLARWETDRPAVYADRVLYADILELTGGV